MYAKKSVSMKVVVLLLAVVLLIGCTVGGTLAWLIANTDPVVNTFTTSDVSITLTETDTTLVDGKYTKEFKMVPGADIAKDPVVTVLEDSEECYVFVKVEKSANFDDYMSYDMAEGWTQVDNNANANVYWRKVTADGMGKDIAVLADNKVHVLDTVTKAMMESAVTTKPTLTFTAYAIQSAHLAKDNQELTDANIADIWALAQSTAVPNS